MTSKPRLFFGLLAAFIFVHGTALAQPEALKAARDAVAESIGRLEEFHKNTPPGAREDQELQLKREALSKIIEFTSLEAGELKLKLEHIQEVEAPFIILLDSYLETLDQFLNRLDTAKIELDELEGAITADEFKGLAASFTDWRTSTYNPALRRMAAFALGFQNRALLKVADQRFVKIAAELKKSKIDTGLTRDALNEAALRLREAREYNNQAIDVMARFLPNNEEEKIGELLIDEKPAPQKTDEDKPEMLIKSMVEKSLGSLRNAYKKFFELNEFIKKFRP